VTGVAGAPASGHRGRGTRRAAALLPPALVAMIAGVLAGALCLDSCAARRVPDFPFKAAAPQLFVATPDGLAALPAGADPQSLATISGPAALVPSASVLSSDGRTIVVAVNRVGPALIESDASGRQYRLRNQALPEPFARLTVGGIWPQSPGYLIQLYRDPFASSPEASDNLLAALLKVDETGKSRPLDASPVIGLGQTEAPGAAGPAFGLFVLYPDPDGGWLAELRRDSPDRVDTRYFALKDPADGAPREVKRSDFETALMPRPLSSLAGARGEALRHALAALLSLESEGGTAVLIRVRGADGTDRYFVDGPDSDDAQTLYAWLLDDGRALLLEQEGRAVIAGSSGSTLSLAFEPPIRGAVFTGLAASRSLVAAAWEAGDFPNLAAAGLLVRDIP